MVKSKSRISANIIIKSHTKAFGQRETNTSSTVQDLVPERGQGADLGSELFVPKLDLSTSVAA